MIALCRGYLAQLRGDAKGTAEFGSQALAESREDEWIVRSVAQGQLAVAEWLDGRLDEAGRAFAHDIAGRRAAGLPTWGAWESYELNQVQHAQGQLDAAVRTCEQALEAVAESGLLPPTAGRRTRGWPRRPTSGSRPCAGVCNRGHRAVRSLLHMPLAAGLATLAWIRQARAIGARMRWTKPAAAGPGRSTASRRGRRGCPGPGDLRPPAGRNGRPSGLIP